MMPVAIEGANIKLGAPSDGSFKECKSLICKQTQLDGHACFVSAWQPTPEELALLLAGASVQLTIYSVTHPPVWVGVGAEMPL